MTVNDYKETACATAGAVEEDVEVDTEATLQPPQPADSENLLGRVLAGKVSIVYFNPQQNLVRFVSRGEKQSPLPYLTNLIPSHPGLIAVSVFTFQCYQPKSRI